MLTKDELLDVAQWLEDAAHEFYFDSTTVQYMQRAEWVRRKVAEME